ncbi:transcriptional repressor [candidate division KSB3 bacterium]|nr:transcriptional repressor [candidate division KSB3 bacterium]
MDNPRERFEELVAEFRQRNYRLTPQRMALLRLLAESTGHPSAAHLHEQIKEQFPTTSLATVYKTLTILKNMQEVLELGFSDDDNRYDGNKPYPHPHLICTRCHSIIDSELGFLQNLEQEVADLSGYHIIEHRLDFYGICPDCQTEEPV